MSFITSFLSTVSLIAQLTTGSAIDLQERTTNIVESNQDETIQTIGQASVLEASAPVKASFLPVDQLPYCTTSDHELCSIVVTAYSSTPDQTDDTPFTTAWQTPVRDGVIAANFLPFGTKVKFPEMYGDKVFTVEDRLARKNSHKIDIWFSTRDTALQFGKRTLVVEILG